MQQNFTQTFSKDIAFSWRVLELVSSTILSVIAKFSSDFDNWSTGVMISWLRGNGPIREDLVFDNAVVLVITTEQRGPWKFSSQKQINPKSASRSTWHVPWPLHEPVYKKGFKKFSSSYQLLDLLTFITQSIFLKLAIFSYESSGTIANVSEINFMSFKTGGTVEARGIILGATSFATYNSKLFRHLFARSNIKRSWSEIQTTYASWKNF